MGIWNQLMYIVMMLFALTSNFSIAATSVCIVLGAVVMIAQKVCTGSLPDMDKGLVKIVAFYCVLQVVAALTAPNPAASLGEVWGIIYRLSPLFMGIGYLQTRRRMAWILVAFAVSVLSVMPWVHISWWYGRTILLLAQARRPPFMPPT